MAAFVDCRSSENIELNSDSIHSIPCEIKYNGEANVKQFYESSIRVDSDEKTASLRGRPLNGRVITLPKGYTGYVLKESRKAYTEDEDRHLTISKKFSEFTHWNLDKSTSADDKIHHALAWINVARSLHRPLDEESSQNSITGH